MLKRDGKILISNIFLPAMHLIEIRPANLSARTTMLTKNVITCPRTFTYLLYDGDRYYSHFGLVLFAGQTITYKS